MRWFFAFFLMLAAGFWESASPAVAQSFPKPNTTRVVDSAQLLSPADESALDGALADFEKKTGRQFVVATIPDLEGYPIEDYGYRLGRAWGIGSKDKDDGVLLIVAPKDRKVRIEVGYGLEPYLTDAYSSLIINRAVLPQFKAGDYPAGIKAGAAAVMEQLQLPPEEAAARLAAAQAETPGDGKGGIPLPLIFWLAILGFMVLPALFGRKRGRRFRSGLPIVIWGPGDWGGGHGGGGFGGGGFGGFSGGGGGFGGGGASGSW